MPKIGLSESKSRQNWAGLPIQHYFQDIKHTISEKWTLNTYSIRNPNPVETERDSQSYTNVLMGREFMLY